MSPEGIELTTAAGDAASGAGGGEGGTFLFCSRPSTLSIDNQTFSRLAEQNNS
jgi:hypothetical protein